jgi:hypothetical protein
MKSKRTKHADPQPMNRRQFLQTVGVSLVGGSLAACRATRTIGQTTIQDVSFRSRSLLPSPQPPAAQAVATPEPEGLADFLALSAVLTGVETLDPLLGRVYLQSLQQAEQFETIIAEVYAQAGWQPDSPPASIEELEATGVFEQEATRTLLDKIIEYWYTGVYDTAEGKQAVATYADALMWRVLDFTKPLTICGAPGFWAERPERVNR